MRTLTRWGYRAPSTERVSGAGKPERHEFDRNQVTRATRWVNTYGNPSYRIYLDDGTAIYLVDDFGGTNDLPCSATVVARRKDL